MQEKLQDIRRFIFEVMPDAEESISSKIPSYKLYGRQLAYFATQNGYVGFYVDAEVVAKLADKLRDYSGSKAGIHLPVDRPFPYGLMKEMLELRAADNLQKVKNKGKKK